MHRSWNRSAAAIATSSWPGLSGPSVAARAGIGGPDKPGHDDEETTLLQGDGLATLVPQSGYEWGAASPGPWFHATPPAGARHASFAFAPDQGSVSACRVRWRRHYSELSVMRFAVALAALALVYAPPAARAA